MTSVPRSIDSRFLCDEESEEKDGKYHTWYLSRVIDNFFSNVIITFSKTVLFLDTS